VGAVDEPPGEVWLADTPFAAKFAEVPLSSDDDSEPIEPCSWPIAVDDKAVVPGWTLW